MSSAYALPAGRYGDETCGLPFIGNNQTDRKGRRYMGRQSADREGRQHFDCSRGVRSQ